MKSSIIICTRNRWHDLVHTVRSIDQQIECPTELLIIDSSDVPFDQSKQHALRQLLVTKQEISVHYFHTKPSLPYQRNFGVQQAMGNIIHFIDDDVDLEPNYFMELEKAFSRNIQLLGCMGSVTNLGPGSKSILLSLYRRFFLLHRDYATGLFTWSGMPTHTYGTNIPRYVEALGGCCMSYRRKVFVKHQFDEHLGGYAFMEDCDFSYRVSRDGPLFYVPTARMRHLCSPVARDKRVKLAEMYGYNYTYLFFKNFYFYNRLKIFVYFWSLLGLWGEHILRFRWKSAFFIIKGVSRYFLQ